MLAFGQMRPGRPAGQAARRRPGATDRPGAAAGQEPRGGGLLFRRADGAVQADQRCRAATTDVGMRATTKKTDGPILGKPLWATQQYLAMNRKALRALARHHPDRVARALLQNQAARRTSL